MHFPLFLSFTSILVESAGGVEVGRGIATGGAKLYFRHGAVSSAKTLSLLAAAHTYEVQQKKVVVIKPKLDTRFGNETVASRAGLSRSADILVVGDEMLPAEKFKDCQCVLVDEAQFLHPSIIDQLRDITISHKIPVICYVSIFTTTIFEI